MYAMLVAQDSDESALLTVVLQRAGFSVRGVKNMDAIWGLWTEQPAELILIAAKRSFSGSQLATYLGKLRVQTDVPVVVVSDLQDEDFQVRLLETGADLLVTRPYSARLLMAQIRSLIRRFGNLPSFASPTLKAGDLELDISARMIRVNEYPPERLTQLEFRLLHTLMIHAGQVIPTEKLVENVWGYNGQGDRDLVRGLVKRLRMKVEQNPQSPVYIITVPGVGYVFQA